MAETLNHLIADIQMLALSLSTQADAEVRRQTLIKIREVSYEATFEVTAQIVLDSYRPAAAKRQRLSHLKYGIDDL